MYSAYINVMHMETFYQLFDIKNIFLTFQMNWVEQKFMNEDQHTMHVRLQFQPLWSGGTFHFFIFFLHTALYIVTNFLGFQICMKNTHYTIVVEPVFSEHFIRKHVLQGGFIHINMMYKEVLFLQTYCTRRFCSYKHAVQGGLVPINMLYKEVLFL